MKMYATHLSQFSFPLFSPSLTLPTDCYKYIISDVNNVHIAFEKYSKSVLATRISMEMKVEK